MASNDSIESTYHGVPTHDENPPTSNGFGKTSKVKVNRKSSQRQPLFQKRRICVYIKCLTALFGVVFAILHMELLTAGVIQMESPASILFKVLVSLSTLALIGSIIFYYIFKYKLDKTSKKRNYGFLNIIGACLLEIVICMIHPFPYEIILKIIRALGASVSMWNIDAYLTFPMFLRLYLVLQLVYELKRIDQNPLTKNIANWGKVKLNTYFVFKFYIHSAPTKVMLFLIVVIILTSSWSVKVCEEFNEYGGYELNFGNAIYFMLITFVTVGYGDIIPETTCGKFVTVFTGFLGICTFALLSAIFVHCLGLSGSERVMFDFMSNPTRQKRYRAAAANAIKFYWLLSKRKSNNLERLKLRRKLKNAIKTMRDLKSKDVERDIDVADVHQLLTQVIRNQNQIKVKLGL